MVRTSASLLQAAAERILTRYLREDGATGIMAIDHGADPERLSGVDIVCRRVNRSVRIKVKPDTYFGQDPRKIADQELVFYRGPSNSYAFETISHHLTREPGWIFSSKADLLYYYFLTLGQTEQEVAALMDEPDEVFFEELAAERDDLRILPMPEIREWFGANYERYTPRPVTLGDHSVWYRIIPESDIHDAVDGVIVKGAVLAKLARH